MKTKKEKKSILFIRGLPDSLKCAFKAECAKRGDTMEATIKALISKYVANPLILLQDMGPELPYRSK